MNNSQQSLQKIFGAHMDFDDTSDDDVVRAHIHTLSRYLARVDLDAQPGLQWLIETTLLRLRRKLGESHSGSVQTNYSNDVTNSMCVMDNSPSIPPDAQCTNNNFVISTRRRLGAHSFAKFNIDRQYLRRSYCEPSYVLSRHTPPCCVPDEQVVYCSPTCLPCDDQTYVSCVLSSLCTILWSAITTLLCCGVVVVEGVSTWLQCVMRLVCVMIHHVVDALPCVTYVLHLLTLRCACYGVRLLTSLLCMMTSLAGCVHCAVGCALTSLAVWTSMAARGWRQLPELAGLLLEALHHCLAGE